METFAKLVAVILVFVILSALMAFPVMWLWNDSLVPAVTWAKPIEWSTAWGIWILASILGGANTVSSSSSK